MILVDLARVTSVDRCRRVDVVHDEIEVAAVVEIHVRRAIRESRLRQSPRFGHVREFEIALVPESVFGKRNLWHLLQQAEIRFGDLLAERCLHRLVADVADVVHVVRPAVDPIRDEQILASIVVEIGKERRPAPVGGEDSRQIADLAELPLAAIELERVARVLRLVARLQLQVVDVEALRVRGRLEDVLTLGQHVERDDVRASIVVEVRGIDAHGKSARVSRRLRYRLGKSPVAVVDIEVVVPLEIVCDVNVRASIVVEIAGDDTESVAVDSVVQAGRIGDVGEVIAIVPEQAIARARVLRAALRLRLDRALGVRRVIEQVHVEITVPVVIEEQRLRRIADVLQSVLLGAIGEGPIAVIDVEHVVPVHREVVDTRDVDVDLPISVDVRHRDARLPAIRISDARFVGDVLELIVPLIAIELVGAEVRREIEIGQAIPVDVAHRDSAAVVVVEVVEDIEVRLLRQRIGEGDAGRSRAKKLEQRG